MLREMENKYNENRCQNPQVLSVSETYKRKKQEKASEGIFLVSPNDEKRPTLQTNKSLDTRDICHPIETCTPDFQSFRSFPFPSFPFPTLFPLFQCTRQKTWTDEDNENAKARIILIFPPWFFVLSIISLASLVSLRSLERLEIRYAVEESLSLTKR